MRIATVSHSHIALRQQLFFREVARQGHEVLMISPGEWGNLRTTAQKVDSWELKTCRHIGESIYQYRLLGARDLAEEFKPDWLYIQAEPGSSLAEEAVLWNVDKRALFTWDNISLKGRMSTLPAYDLVVCGNPEAEELVKPWNPHTLLLLQVGVDTDHFQSRPGVLRDVDVAYVGRMAEEKGLVYLLQAWPTVRILEQKDFKELPWWYSQIKVLVAYSQDISTWKEQAPNYVVLEALACGCKAVVSDTKAMEYWLRGCPGVVMVEGHEQSGSELDPVKVDRLKTGIQRALEVEVGEWVREWVGGRFSNQEVAKRLLEVMVC